MKAGIYRRKIYHTVPQAVDIPYYEAPIPPEIVNTIIVGSSEDMSSLPKASIHLIVTSPPYNVGKEYDDDLSLEEYVKLIERVGSEMFRVLVPGGRICINTAGIGHNPRIPLSYFVTNVMLSLGFLMRAEIIWVKGASGGYKTAWGSWASSTNPSVRDEHEYIDVFSKATMSRKECGREHSIPSQRFVELATSVWNIPAANASQIGHPAPFPLELPLRCIELFSMKGDVVLDPFMGSGQTAIAALRLGRRFVGYEKNEEYAMLARRRIKTDGA